MGYRIDQAKFWIRKGPRHFYERARYGVSYLDVWNLDNYLAQVIARGTSQLADNAHGYPPHLTPESWSAILRDLAGYFQRYHDASFDDKHVDMERGFELLKIHFPALWD